MDETKILMKIWKKALDFQSKIRPAVFAIAKTFIYDLFFSGHHSLIKVITQTAVTNKVNQRIFIYRTDLTFRSQSDITFSVSH